LDVRAGEAWPVPGLGFGGPGDVGVRAAAVRVDDVVIAEVCSESSAVRFAAGGGCGDRVLMCLVRRGAWRFARPGGTVTVAAGAFIACREGPPSPSEVDPWTAAMVLVLPASGLGPLAGGGQVTGSADSAEARVLMAHAGTVRGTAEGLSPEGVRGARDALVRLAGGVLRRECGGAGPGPALVLARAAMEAADGRLADPGLSPSSLAGELHVSVRTLHRAFAAAGEPVAAYIRRRRLEQARAELAVRAGRPGVSEVAARWQFADGSHFVRAFRKQYGQTPSQFACPGAAGRGC
jgi:AraC-like DNA-binding protein